MTGGLELICILSGPARNGKIFLLEMFRRSGPAGAQHLASGEATFVEARRGAAQGPPNQRDAARSRNVGDCHPARKTITLAPQKDSEENAENAAQEKRTHRKQALKKNSEVKVWANTELTLASKPKDQCVEPTREVRFLYNQENLPSAPFEFNRTPGGPKPSCRKRHRSTEESSWR